MKREDFEGLVARAVDELPQEFQERLENIAVVVEDWPSQDLLSSVGLGYRSELLGLYEGIPLIRRSQHHSALPDKITIFRRPIEMICRSEDEVVEAVQGVVRHEIAHHFGISDKRLREIEDKKNLAF